MSFITAHMLKKCSTSWQSILWYTTKQWRSLLQIAATVRSDNEATFNIKLMFELSFCFYVAPDYSRIQRDFGCLFLQKVWLCTGGQIFMNSNNNIYCATAALIWWNSESLKRHLKISKFTCSCTLYLNTIISCPFKHVKEKFTNEYISILGITYPLTKTAPDLWPLCWCSALYVCDSSMFSHYCAALV